MQQIVQDRGRGKLRIADVPAPMATPGHVVIANSVSVLSAGTERMARELAQSSLLAKARQRPDQVRRVLQKLRQEGLIKTVQQVRATLSEPQTLGYSSAGIVLACGHGVQGIRPGDRVASNGPHAEVVSVPKRLCAVVPEPVPDEHAAFTVLGAIALQGIRLTQAGLGDTVFVLGLGLVGQIAVALARAAGCRVVGSDPDPRKCVLARTMGAEVARPHLGATEILELTSGLGADAVLIAAATSSNEPVNIAAEAVRKKGRVVFVGAVGMDLPRKPFFEKEAELVVSCSYGPGRYDPVYEERGRDYPPAYVRWTEERNLQAVLGLMAAGNLDVSHLISHRFDVTEADRAYELIEGDSEPYLGVLLRYPAGAERTSPIRTHELLAPTPAGGVGVGCIGAGAFARSVLLPAIAAAGDALQPRVLCSAGGLSAAESGENFGFSEVTSDESVVLGHRDVAAVFIATRHDSHARQVVQALAAGKHVFVEKPLALSVEEMEAIEEELAHQGGSSPLLMVGFNRRFSPAAAQLRRFFEEVRAPLTVSYRFNAGALSPDHWTQDDEVGGGRIVGEACHAIDLVTFLTGSVPVRVYADSIGGPEAPAITDDQSFITLRHANGSVSSIGYLAGGDKAFPKERVEVFGGGRVGVIDDFREVITVSGGRRRASRSLQQDKGHRAEVEQFARAVAGGGASPIPWGELRAVSLAAILAVRSLREGVPLVVPGGPGA